MSIRHIANHRDDAVAACAADVASSGVPAASLPWLDEAPRCGRRSSGSYYHSTTATIIVAAVHGSGAGCGVGGGVACAARHPAGTPLPPPPPGLCPPPCVYAPPSRIALRSNTQLALAQVLEALLSRRDLTEEETAHALAVCVCAYVSSPIRNNCSRRRANRCAACARCLT